MGCTDDRCLYVALADTKLMYEQVELWNQKMCLLTVLWELYSEDEESYRCSQSWMSTKTVWLR